MKCPECGQWNRASMPRCQRCGAPLDLEAAPELEWKNVIKDRNRGAAYIRVDDDGQLLDNPDARDVLAEEMAELKIRKEEGTRQLYRMRRENDDRIESGEREIRTRSNVTATWASVNEPLDQTRVRRTQRRATHAEGGSRTVVHRVASEQPVWDDEIRAYDAGWQEREALAHTNWQLPQDSEFTGHLPSRARGLRRFIRVITALVILLLIVLCGFFGYHYFMEQNARRQEENAAMVVSSIKDDLAAHTIMIPGSEGSQIYIRELHTTYIVTGGFATIEVIDHTWYDNLEEFPEGDLTVTLTPYVKTSSGQQKPLDVITYDIEIPRSPITMTSPDSLRTEVVSSMYTLSFTVRPGSTVYINDKNVTDTVDANGDFNYNATVQAIGDNVFNVRVRSQYCRETLLTVVLYRAPQEIPLDLAADTYTSTSSKAMLVNATTLPGATIEVLSNYTDLDITNLDTTGAFSFYAVFDKYGDNIIKINSHYPGRKTSSIEYKVYYVPNQDQYTPKAWPLSAEGYSELVGNIAYRAEHTQVYVVMGVIDHFVSEKPQMAVVYTSADGKSQPVLVQNFTKTTWEEGQFYRIYADVYGSYDNMPWLYARYTYAK